MQASSQDQDERFRKFSGGKSAFERAVRHAEWLLKRTEQEPECLGYAKQSSKPYVRGGDDLRTALEKALVDNAGYGCHEALAVLTQNDAIDLVVYDRYENLMEAKSLTATVEEVMSARKRYSRALQPLGAAIRSFSEGKFDEAIFLQVVEELERLGGRKFYRSPQHIAHMGRGSGSYFGGDITNIPEYAKGLSMIIDRGMSNLLPLLGRAPDFERFKQLTPRHPANYRNAFAAAMVLAHDKDNHKLDTHALPLAAHGVIFETLLGRIVECDLDSIKRIADNFDLSLTYDALASHKPVRSTASKPLQARSGQFTPLLLIRATLDSMRRAQTVAPRVIDTIDILLDSGLRHYMKDPAHLAQLTMRDFRHHLERSESVTLRAEVETRVPFKSLTADLKPLEVFNLAMNGVDAAMLEYENRLKADRSVLAQILPKLSVEQQAEMFGQGMGKCRLLDEDRKYATAASVIADRLALDLGL